jgi:hypothetical protein
LTCAARTIEDPASAFYLDALARLDEAGVGYLVGGTFAFTHYARIERETKDLDVFVRPQDSCRALAVFDEPGYRTELRFPHWLGKVHCDGHFMDIIFSSGNGVARVDDGWFEHATGAEILGFPAKLCPAEEMMWSKAFVQERERFGADVAHLIRALGPSLDWDRLLARFGDHWRVLYAHVVLFGYIYPDRREHVPAWVMDELAGRLAADRMEPENHVCNGTLLSREQYLVDLERDGYVDGRLQPDGPMTREEIDVWTAAIVDEK